MANVPDTDGRVNDLSNIPLVRGGAPGVGATVVAGYDAGVRTLLRSTDALQSRMEVGKGYDPLRLGKNVMGKALAVGVLDQAYTAYQEGRSGDAASYGIIGATIVATSVEPIAGKLAHGATKVPVVKEIAHKLSGVLDKVQYVTKAGKALPFAGVAMNAAHGIVSGGVRAAEGDKNGATCELAVAGAGVGTAVVGITASVLLCGPAAPLCLTATYILSEAATEAASRSCNKAMGTNVRGSMAVTLAQYGGTKAAQLVHGDIPQMPPLHATAAKAATGFTKQGVQFDPNAPMVWDGASQQTLQQQFNPATFGLPVR